MTQLQADALMLFCMVCMAVEAFGRRRMQPRPRGRAEVRDAVLGVSSLIVGALFFGSDLMNQLSGPPQPAPAWQAYSAVGMLLLSAIVASARFVRRLRGRV